MKIPKQLVSSRFAYKYAIVNNKKKNNDPFEEIVEYQKIFGDPVNRCLVIKQECVTENSKLTKVLLCYVRELGV